MSEIHQRQKSNGSHKPELAEIDFKDQVEEFDDDAEKAQDQPESLHLRAVTSKKTVELPDLVERAQRQVQNHLKSAEQDAATYADRLTLIDAEIEKADSDKTQAEDQVRYWQAVQENTVHVIEVLRQRRAGPQAALDALRKNGIQ